MTNGTNDSAITATSEGKQRRLTRTQVLGAMTLFGAAASTVGGWLLRMMGDVGHRAHLAAWGIVDTAPFAKSGDWNAVNGYYAYVDRSISLLAAMGENRGAIAFGFCVLTIYFAVVWSVVRRPAPKWVRQLSKRMPKWIDTLVASGFGAFLILLGIPSAMVAIALLMIVPDALGRTYGQAAMRRELEEFDKGCKPTNLGQCMEFRKDGKLLFRGFVLDGSESVIAVYDVDEKKSRIEAREGISMISANVVKVP
jgi:hypothetical protein